MPFVELQPPLGGKGIATGVRLSLGGRAGLRISLAGEALVALGIEIGKEQGVRLRVLHDADPALPGLRLVRDDTEGRFTFVRPPRGDTWRWVRLGRPSFVPKEEFKAFACTWERAADRARTIDIDLPREFRSAGKPLAGAHPGLAPREKVRV